MTQLQREEDIAKLDIFNSNELEIQGSHTEQIFKSIEFHTIFHFSNAELYYMTDEDSEIMEAADEKHDTEKGMIYCAK